MLGLIYISLKKMRIVLIDLWLSVQGGTIRGISGAFVIIKVKCINFLDVDFKVSRIKVFGKLIFFITFIVPLQHFCLIHSIYFRLSRPPEFSLKIGAKL